MSDVWVVFKKSDAGVTTVRSIHSTMEGAHREARVLQAEETALGFSSSANGMPYYPFIVEMFEVSA